MFKTTVSSLWTERGVAVENRDRKLAMLPQIKRAYHGSAYDEATGDEKAANGLLNYGFSMIGLLQPAVVWRNPRAIVGSKRQEVQDAEAQALELGLNRWIEEVRLRDTLDKLLVDTVMCWGVAHVTREPAPGEQEHSDPIYWPQVNRLPQDQVFWDSEAKSWETKRFAGHDWFIDHEDLIARAEADQQLPEDEREGWNLETIKLMQPDARSDSYAMEDQDRRSGLREQVQISEYWVPEVELDSIKKLAEEQGKTPAQLGYHGTLYYIGYGVFNDPTENVQNHRAGKKESAKFVREPQPYFGSSLGPYALFGTHTVPDESFPLGMLVAAHEQIESVNEIYTANHNAARDYKRIYAVDESSVASVKKWQDAETGEIVPLPVPSSGKVGDAIQELERGGLTQQGLTQADVEREIADQALGLTESQRGNVAGGTATENAIAQGASSQRIEYFADKFERDTLKVLENVGELLWMDDSVVLPLGSQSSMQRDLRGALFVGGRPDAERYKQIKARFPEADIPAPADGQEDELGQTYNDLELKIEVGSMGRKSEMARRAEAQSLLEFGTTIVPILPQIAPFWDVDRWVSQIGEKMGQPDLNELIDMEGLAAIAQMQIQAPQEEARLSRTTGGQPQYAGGAQAQTKRPSLEAPKAQTQGLSTGQAAKTGAA